MAESDFASLDEIGEPGEHGYGGDAPGDPYGGQDPGDGPEAVPSHLVIGSQKSGVTTKGNVSSDFDPNAKNIEGSLFGATKAMRGETAGAPSQYGLSRAGRDALAARSADLALRGAGQQQQYDSPLKIGWDQPLEKGASIFTGKDKDTSAAEEEQKYGEFSQVQFNAAINKVDNPLANRSSLPPEIAWDIASNPLSKRSSGGEKALAGLEMVAPFGTISTLIRTMAMSRGFGAPQKAGGHVFSGGEEPHKPIRKTGTIPQYNRTQLAIPPVTSLPSTKPDRGTIRAWRSRGRV